MSIKKKNSTPCLKFPLDLIISIKSREEIIKLNRRISGIISLLQKQSILKYIDIIVVLINNRVKKSFGLLLNSFYSTFKILLPSKINFFSVYVVFLISILDLWSMKRIRVCVLCIFQVRFVSYNIYCFGLFSLSCCVFFVVVKYKKKMQIPSPKIL